MLLETLAAVSLHCTAQVSRSVKGPRWNDAWREEVMNASFPIRVYVDYDRPWGYIELCDTPTEDRKLATPSVVVSNAQIRVVDGFFGFHRIDDLTINRSSSEFRMALVDATSPTRDTLRYAGTCEPGEPFPIPETPTPRF